MLNSMYDKKTILLYVLAFGAIMLGMKFTDGAAFAILIPCALGFLAGRHPEKLIFVILVSILTLIGNPYFMPKGIVYAVCQRGLMMALGGLMMVQIFGRRNAPQLTPVLWMLPYLVYMACVSFVGWSPLISYLKLMLFSFIFIGIYAAANRAIVGQMDVRKFRSMFLAVSCVMLIGSVLVLPLGGIGYMGAEEVLKDPTLRSLFKGMTNHSQALGPITAFFGILVFADWLFSIQRMDKLYAVLMLCVPILLIKTASRTAMGAFLAGCLFLFFYFMRSRKIRIPWRGKVSQLAMGVGGLALIAVLLVPAARNRVAKFVLKYHTEGTQVSLNTEDILYTRQGKIDECLRNWRQSPHIGNGFQVSEEMKGFRASSLKQVLTAPVEKSTWIVAILEEGGWIGEALFVFYVIVCLALLVRRRAYIGATCFATMVVINLGEFTIFSMSGSGGSIWGLTFVAIILDTQRIKAEDTPPPPPPNWMDGPMGMPPPMSGPFRGGLIGRR